MNFFFLILNYKTIDETKKCIASINNLHKDENDNIFLYVVDNGSNQGDEIEKACPNCHVIKLENNLGFSAGNNAGYTAILNQNEKVDFVICTNNDIEFLQNDFLDRIKYEYKKSNFHILGPDIIKRKTKGHQSPLSLKTLDEAGAQHFISIYQKTLDSAPYCRYLIVIEDIHDLCDKINVTRYIRAFKRKFLRQNIADYSKRYENNLVLQGACIIFSSNFTQENSKLFEPEVFLYNEEYFLALKCLQKKYKMIYNPELKVLHGVNCSAKQKKSKTQLRRFCAKHQISSFNTYMKTLHKETDNK